MKAGRGLGKALGCQSESGGCTRRDKETALDIGHWKIEEAGRETPTPPCACEVPSYLGTTYILYMYVLSQSSSSDVENLGKASLVLQPISLDSPGSLLRSGQCKGRIMVDH